MKKCTKCKIKKSLEEFHKHPISKDGRKPRCKSCRKEETSIRYKKHKTKLKEARKEWVYKNRDKLNKYRREYYKKNKESMLQACSEYRDRNREKIRAYSKRVRKEFPEKRNYYTSLRRARIKEALPAWLTKEQKQWIAWHYKQAKMIENLTGVKCHVDHIHPIKGKTLCGLHVPWNLQVIPATENRKKNNKLYL